MRHLIGIAIVGLFALSSTAHAEPRSGSRTIRIVQSKGKPRVSVGKKGWVNEEGKLVHWPTSPGDRIRIQWPAPVLGSGHGLP